MSDAIPEYENEDYPVEVEHLELKGDALLGDDTANSIPTRLSMGRRDSPSPRAAPSSRLAPPSSSLSRRRGRSDAPPLYAESNGSVSPTGSAISLSLTTPRSTRSMSTAAPSVDPRGDQELIAMMCDGVGDQSELTSLDLSLAPKKVKKSLKSLRSIADYASDAITELNVANNAVATLDGVECLPELSFLCVSRNHLKRLDAALFTLTNLKTLDVSGNFISHIPRGITALAVLEVINLAGNNLTALKEIDVLAKLMNLHACSFAGNPFCKLPTYKDYVVSKLASIERLDDSVVSDAARDKSRRRFSEELFSKDKCLREAGLAHANEQSKLRDAQLALEAENSRLKDELQLKSKLLQNKSKAWSSATEQLIQLQQELAMMNLDRRGVPTASVQQDQLESEPRYDAGVQHQEGEENSNQPHETIPRLSEPLHHATARVRSVSSPPKHKTLVDSACSPFPHRDAEVKQHIAPAKPRAMTDHSTMGMLSPYEPRSIRSELPVWDHDTRRDDDLLHLTAYEDDHACPAYDDPVLIESPTKNRHSRGLSPSATADPRSQTRSPLASPSSRVQRRWEQQHQQFIVETSHTPAKSPRRSQVVGLLDSDNLARQIQALQSCKQSLVSEIAKEEQFLHELKRESAGYANQVERLDSDLQVLLGAGRTGMNRAGASASRQREEETIRAKLEMLRSKLHYAEDKEAEIEATIVRMTKRVLDNDIQQAQAYGFSPEATAKANSSELFDKEIFALTHKLQSVIVQKEEIHAEMSRLMHQLRSGEGAIASSSSTGLSAEALLLIDQQEQVQRVAVDNQEVFIDKQRKCDECKRKLRVVHDRIKVKEDMIAALVVELKDVESELSYINTLLPPRPPSQHRRALSLDSHTGSLCDLSEPVEAYAASIEDAVKLKTRGDKSPRKQVTGSASTSAVYPPPPPALSSMVEAAAADMNEQFEQKFKELFSPDVLESIKQDIYRKLAHLMPTSPSSRAKAAGGSGDQDSQLHAAITAALETHVKTAMQHLEKPRDGSSPSAVVAPIASQPPGSPKKSTPQVHEDDSRCWDEVDDFNPVQDARYTAKFRFIRERAASHTGPLSPATSTSRSAAVQRVLKACERLEQAENESKIDSISSIEIDATGRKKSALKIVLMGARDLPTAHLRTKNLDPYVAMEVVYPEHVVPSSGKPPLLTLGRQSMLEHANASLLHPLTPSFRSRTVKKSVYPIWDEEFTFEPIQSLKGYLHVRVLNDRCKLSREQLVGEAKIPLRSLVHQRKVVDSFVLRTTPGRSMTPSESQRKAMTGVGTVRLQLQLSFSRLDKAKRLVDELVAKFQSEYSQLPAFIERIEEYEARLAHEVAADSTSESHAAEREQSETPEVEELPTFEDWKAHQQQAASGDSATGGGSPEGSPTPARLSAARSASLWSTPQPTAAAAGGGHISGSPPKPSTVAAKKEPIKMAGGYAAVDESVRRAQPTRPIKPTATHSNTRPSTASRSSTASAKAAMEQLRRMVKASTPATSTLPNAGAGFSILHNQSRRKTMSGAPVAPMASTSFTPECFDEYSPYHPDFQLLDPLGMDSQGGMPSYVGPGTQGKLRSSSYSSGLPTTRGHTDLRIFKSPGFSRREPSGGFPERFIGLDNQTSERMKRMFGRIDYPL